MSSPVGRYQLSLFFLLLSVYYFTHARPFRESAALKVATFENSVSHYFHPVTDIRTKVTERFNPDSRQWERLYVKINEEEVLEPSRLKTYTGVGNYLNIFFSAKSKHLLNSVAERLPAHIYWFNATSRECSILCLFRI
jgi:hypothetical protein